MTGARSNIVIITYNALPYTRVTLDSLFATTKTPYNLTIIDNGSNHDTIEYLNNLTVPEFCLKKTIILNNENMGVGHAYNQGQRVSFTNNTEFTVFCNNDLFFSSNWLRKLESRMDYNPNVAMLSPLRPSAKVKYNNKSSTREVLMTLQETDNWRDELEQYTKLPLEDFDGFCDKVISANLSGDLEIITFPDSLSTCICMTRNNSFTKIQRFADPIFTGYGGEDIDMSWTIMELGYYCAVDHNVYIHHFRGKSLKSNNINRSNALKISNKKLYIKWKQTIHDFIDKKLASGDNVISTIDNDKNGRYWLLHELNNDEHFTDEYKDPMYEYTHDAS